MASRYNLVIDQGSTWEQALLYRDPSGAAIDLTGCTARMQVREFYESEEPLVSIDTDDGITISSGGRIDLVLTAEQTADIPAGKYVYDLELVNGDVVTRLLQGRFVVDPEVTR